MINKEETKIFLKAINAISSCRNMYQVRFMVKWVSMAKEKNKITDEKYLRIIDSMINTRKKQFWNKGV